MFQCFLRAEARADKKTETSIRLSWKKPHLWCSGLTVGMKWICKTPCLCYRPRVYQETLRISKVLLLRVYICIHICIYCESIVLCKWWFLAGKIIELDGWFSRPSPVLIPTEGTDIGCVQNGGHWISQIGWYWKMTGWWFGCHFFIVPRNIGIV